MDTNKRLITLDEFIISRQKDFKYATGDLSKLLRYTALASKVVHQEVNKAGLVDILGVAGSTNIQGEVVKKLDLFANDHFMAAFQQSGVVAAVASEEEDTYRVIDESADYVVAMDPLDGSSNIDVNVSIGTIFSIMKRVTKPGTPVSDEDFFRTGNDIVASGYVIYGSSTMMVYTTGRGVNGFTLDPGIGEFCLSHPDMKIPEEGKVYSINQGYYSKFEPSMRQYLDWCLEVDTASKRPYSLRYIGSMVADFHRNLITGGIYIYPSLDGAPKGKLRLLFECAPLALLAEQAGGKATDGKQQRILDITCTEIHQRVPIFVGSAAMVEKAETI